MYGGKNEKSTPMIYVADLFKIRRIQSTFVKECFFFIKYKGESNFSFFFFSSVFPWILNYHTTFFFFPSPFLAVAETYKHQFVR